MAFLLAGSAGLGLASAGFGCLACNSAGCSAGFSLRLEARDPGGFEPGAYNFDITVEESVFRVRCVFTENNETSVCDQAVRTQGDGHAFPDLTIGSRPDPDRPDPVGYVYITAVDASDSDGDFKAYRGPEYVEVSVEREGVEVGSVEYTPEYERRNHRGDPDCGYCDEAEEIVDSV